MPRPRRLAAARGARRPGRGCGRPADRARLRRRGGLARPGWTGAGGGGPRAAGDVVERAIAAIRDGAAVLLPTDTVYGLCAAPSEQGIDRAYTVKGRVEAQPTALLASRVDRLLELVPELHGSSARIMRALLPGPYTLVLPNPARRFPRLTGARPA